jgi:superfamily I DNA/RNA helicase
MTNVADELETLSQSPSDPNWRNFAILARCASAEIRNLRSALKREEEDRSKFQVGFWLGIGLSMIVVLVDSVLIWAFI